jgi:ribosomal protein L11 methyltransferase
MNHCRISFYTQDEELRGRLIAVLDEAGFTAFEETDHALLAFIPQDRRAAIDLDQILPAGSPRREESVIEPENWNAVWEASFEPVIVPGFCTVRAHFHKLNPDTPHDIVITPKMSFGTGHHATTRLMMEAMRDLPFRGARVLDFGAGTGILAILAAQLGAGQVLAIDNDEWSVDNARENVAANEAGIVEIRQGSLEAASAGEPFDIILANINRHILLRYMEDMHRLLVPGGSLLLSGVLAADEEVITNKAILSGFKKQRVTRGGDWIAILVTR